MRGKFTDYFATVAVDYASSRPTYPPELFQWLAGQCSAHGLAWDCGTGSGQAALALVDYFDQVIATDASAAQLAQGRPHPKVSYRLASAENSGLEDASVDLVTVAQALHWFDFRAFFAEVQRVLKPDGLFAAWSYGRLSVDGADVNALVQEFCRTDIAPFWPSERQHVETAYRLIDCPLPRIKVPDFAMSLEWSLPQLLGYIRSWSATTQFVEAKGYDPVVILEEQLRPLWGGEDRRHRVTWPLALLGCRNFTRSHLPT